ncbi:hypothetical protein V6N13_029727 [Hibiscus sabdariffa]|uniref:Uncharacterized protein n=1 Tax=Hibiscus sabdariffa TaxID=183260 RepID=A0ABR2T9T1_9ROSI
MSHQILTFVLALIAILGMVSAKTKAVASPTFVAATPGPIEDIVKSAGAPAIGNSGTVESPAGSAALGSNRGAAAAAAGAMNAAAPGQPPSSDGATTIMVSPAFTGAAAIAGYFLF